MRKSIKRNYIILLIIVLIIIGVFIFLKILNFNKINIPKDYDERINYCKNLCGALFTHDPCANDCMAGVKSEFVKKRNFSLMTSEELKQFCTNMCPVPNSSCIEDCITTYS